MQDMKDMQYMLYMQDMYNMVNMKNMHNMINMQNIHIFIHPAAPHGATKLFCPRRKGAGPPLSHQGGEA